MFKKVLIANRGDAALRILRACRELGVPSVVVYSEADRDSLPVMLADEAVCIGPAAPQDSYLNVSRILSAAEITHCDALHPGYGWLADSAEFAEATGATGLSYVGSTPDTMRRVLDRISGRRLARDTGLPVVPGSEAEVASTADAQQVCSTLGYPVMIKAASGSGPAVKQVVRKEKDLETGLRICQAEAKAASGDGRVYVEKQIVKARHVEVQVLADKHGTVTVLPERDCSVQFRHQKLLEESPSPAVSPELRTLLGEWSSALARAGGLSNIGTAEFLMDEDGSCYFLEMDCRLHVEHGVSEEVTGIDIVRLQLLAAAGEKLSLHDPGRCRGHSIECRVCAQDPDAGFEPSSGLVTDVRMPAGPGTRVDCYLTPGYTVQPEYEPLIARLIAWAPDRDQAVSRMDRMLSETSVDGIATTLNLHRRLMQSGRFRRGRLAIGMLDEELGA